MTLELTDPYRAVLTELATDSYRTYSVAEYLVDRDCEGREDVVNVVFRFGSELFVAFTVAFLLFEVGIAGSVLTILADASTATPFAAVVWLQAGVLAVALLFHRAARVVEEWSPGGDALGDGLAGRFGLSAADVPRWYVAVLVGQFVLASVAPGLVDPFVYARPLVARGVELLLLSGVAQGALAAVAGGLACVAIAPVARRSVVFWTGTSPGYTLAFAAGGATAGRVDLVGP
jgi:hypothetical protein